MSNQQQHGDSLNPQHFSASEEPYQNPQGFNSLPPNYDASEHLTFEDVKQDQQQQPQSSRLDHFASQQFNDYPLYPQPEEQNLQGLFDLSNPPASGGGSINPAALMGGSPTDSSHHQTPSLQIPEHQTSPGRGQSGSASYLSAASTQPSATGAFEWDSIIAQTPAWTNHRRAPSEYSDTPSAAPSPFLAQREYSEQPSPLLHGQSYPDQPSMQELLDAGESFGLSTFSLSEHEPSPSPAAHSAENSPYMLPQDQMMGFVPPVSAPMSMGPPRLLGTEDDHREALGDDSFPKINISFAPPQRQPTFPGKPGLVADDGALGPPPRSAQRRQRSKSDPYAAKITRPLSPSNSRSSSRSRSPSHSRHSSLSPSDIASPSSAASTKSRRSSTTSLPNRDYILELAHPNRPGAPATDRDSKRVQKHPANFQCTLCPKRFTRAYNLRSHLRTHTDERPFVCTVCGKAFARQHDRKRHEGLHSGEKKFVCRGPLKTGRTWGCGRRFARADALGRHFRSEAGRVCIQPLLDEETQERQMMQQQELTQTQQMQTHQMLPNALLVQYPDLAGVNWSALQDGEGESGRSSFDASGGEWDGEGGWEEGGWASDTGVGVSGEFRGG